MIREYMIGPGISANKLIIIRIIPCVIDLSSLVTQLIFVHVKKVFKQNCIVAFTYR